MKNFSIPEPCSEDWSAMTPTEKGAFCSSCAHEVHDLSSMSNREIRELFFKNLGKRTCVRMKPEQEIGMNQDFLDWQKSKQNHIRSAMFFSLLVVFGLTLFSCTNPEQVKDLDNLREAVLISMNQIEKPQESESLISSEKLETILPQLHVVEIQPEKVQEPAEIVGHTKDFEEVVVTELIDDSYYVTRMTRTMGLPALRTEYIEFIEEENQNLTDVELNSEGRITEFKGLAFPNPAVAQTTLEIELPENTEALFIRLLDLNGRIIAEINNNPKEMGVHRFPINLSDLKTGTYLADVRYNDKKQIVRIIKGY